MNELLSQEAIVREGDQYPVLKLSDKGRRILFNGEERVFALKRKESAQIKTDRSAAVRENPDEALFDQLLGA